MVCCDRRLGKTQCRSRMAESLAPPRGESVVAASHPSKISPLEKVNNVAPDLVLVGWPTAPLSLTGVVRLHRGALLQIDVHALQLGRAAKSVKSRKEDNLPSVHDAISRACSLTDRA